MALIAVFFSKFVVFHYPAQVIIGFDAISLCSLCSHNWFKTISNYRNALSDPVRFIA